MTKGLPARRSLLGYVAMTRGTNVTKGWMGDGGGGDEGGRGREEDRLCLLGNARRLTAARSTEC